MIIHISSVLYRYIRVGVLRDVTRFLKSDWYALYAAKALYQAFSSREKAWLREAMSPSGYATAEVR